MADQPAPDFAREQWLTNIALRERELTLKEHESKRAWWANPLTLAIFAAPVAAAGTGFVTWMNDRAQRDLEERKAEAARILEVVKTGDPDKAAKNLQFLIDTGLNRQPTAPKSHEGMSDSPEARRGAGCVRSGCAVTYNVDGPRVRRSIKRSRSGTEKEGKGNKLSLECLCDPPRNYADHPRCDGVNGRDRGFYRGDDGVTTQPE
jgi:hypothetical protein